MQPEVKANLSYSYQFLYTPKTVAKVCLETKLKQFFSTRRIVLALFLQADWPATGLIDPMVVYVAWIS